MYQRNSLGFVNDNDAMLQADAFEPEQWRDQLQGAVGVVSCLGGFGSNDFMLKVPQWHITHSSYLS